MGQSMGGRCLGTSRMGRTGAFSSFCPFSTLLNIRLYAVVLLSKTGSLSCHLVSLPALSSPSTFSLPRSASYMIASSASLDEFSKNLGREMDIKPLRPNVLVGPASPGQRLKPWAEDFWGELRIKDGAPFFLFTPSRHLSLTHLVCC